MHAHDWQAGLAPVYLSTIYASHPVLGGDAERVHDSQPRLSGRCSTPTGCRGSTCRWEQLVDRAARVLGTHQLPEGRHRQRRRDHHGQPAYAEEIQTPEFGFGFDGILRARARRSGRHPERHRHARVGSGDAIRICRGRSAPTTWPESAPRKRAVLERYGLPADDAALARPLIGMISRMVDQKGFDLIAAVADELAAPRRDVRRARHRASRATRSMWRALAARHPDRVGARIGFDETLAHLIEGGADMFLMPSRFEPCGLNQMYSLRYGTVPVVHAVGGLADTVADYSPRTHRATGFVFHEYTPAALLGALRRALARLRRPDALAGAAGGRHAAGLFLGPFGPRVRQNI